MTQGDRSTGTFILIDILFLLVTTSRCGHLPSGCEKNIKSTSPRKRYRATESCAEEGEEVNIVGESAGLKKIKVSWQR